MRSVRRSRVEPNVFARELFKGLPARYDLLAEVLSFGQNHRWRRAMVDAVLRMNSSSGRVLDVATGTAGVSLMLTDRSGVTTTGIDVSADMLRRGQSRVARRARGDRIRLVLGKAEQLPFPANTFDALTFTYLLRYVADPAATLQELFRVVRPGGTIANLEFLVPSNPVWRAGWVGYTRAVLPAAGFVTGGREWAKVGHFLGPSISEHYRRYPIEWTIAAWEAAGAEDVTVRRMSLGGGLVMWGRKASG
ncbi:class I SAM-dependent methyltransferase [Micromonospora sp. NPDC047548]|uniref:class I SAM-dependent methyltransferase n=1 Tax=Micromonospora sp. NPDC047548 TaxID=3155624 RepID=UPI0033C83D84